MDNWSKDDAEARRRDIVRLRCGIGRPRWVSWVLAVAVVLFLLAVVRSLLL